MREHVEASELQLPPTPLCPAALLFWLLLFSSSSPSSQNGGPTLSELGANIPTKPSVESQTCAGMCL